MKFKIKYRVLIIIFNLLLMFRILNPSTLYLPKQYSRIPETVSYITEDISGGLSIIQKKINTNPEIRINSLSPLNPLGYFIVWPAALILCFIPLKIIIDIRSKINSLLNRRFEGSKYKPLPSFS